MNRKKLGIIASVLALLILTVWFTQGYDAGAQSATAAMGANPDANSTITTATAAAAPRKTANARSSTPQRQSNAMLAAQTGQYHTAATSTAHIDKTGSDTNNNAAPSQSPNQTRARIKPAPLEPRAEPYALMANSGSATVRFSVRLIGDADPATTIYLRQDGADGVIALNDQGVDGDIVAGDNIHGGNIVLDTSRLQPDTCLSYFALLKDGENETVSSPLNLCISNLPVRTAASNTDNPVVFTDGSKAVADEILVTAQPGTKIAAMQAIAASISATIVGSIPPLNLYQLKLPSPATEAQLRALVEQLNAQYEVKGASVNAIGEAAAAPNDPEYVNQHGLQLVRAQDVWDAGATGNGVIVTVLDTGIDRTHPDFGTAGNCQLAENDCGSANTDAAIGTTPAGHGTQVAGVIAAKSNNSLGVAGIAHGSKIHSIHLNNFTIIGQTQGFIDAAAYGTASVINASFNVVDVFSTMDSLCAAIESAVMSGGEPIAIVVNAAGNQNINGASYPGRCNDLNAGLIHKELLITVSNSASINHPNCGSVNVDQRCAPGIPADPALLGSNFGSWVDIAAPGSVIRTTSIGNTYTSPTGTSFSTPMVSGAVAILKSCGMPLNQIESTLLSSTNVTVPYPGGATPRLDVYRALQQVNHSPTAVILSNSSLNDGTNTTGGVEVGTLTPTDPDTCDKHTYSIVAGFDAAKFSIPTATNRLILTDGVLNYATKPSYTVVVHVTDFFGASYDQTLTVNVAAVNHAPTISSQTFRINEGSANGTAVGTVLASDPDSGNVLTYSITAGNTSNAFSIDTNTGVLSVSNSTALVYATNPSFSLTVTVTDGGGLSANATVTVDVNKAPSISNQTFSVNEGTANGTSVGAVVASDAGDTLSYSITAGNTSGAFSINSSTGVLSVGSSAALVYATNPTFGLTVRVTDSGSLTATATVTVNVNAPGTPINNSPVIANQTFVVADGSANGTVVGSVVASDPDAGNTLSYSITGGNTGSTFSINASTGVLSVASSAAVSYASNPTFSLSVRVADNGGLSATTTVTVNVNAPVTPPPPSDGGGGGGGCSVMPVGASPDYSLALAVLVLLGYGVRRRRLGSLKTPYL
ncbi:MAG: cadherin domain-containing protein [Sideroxyarcus sp.]